MNRLSLPLAAAVLALLSPAASFAVPISSSDSGNYDNTGLHTPAIDNYLTGVLGGGEFRSFFLFDLTAFATGTINGATLTLSNREADILGTILPGTAGAPFTLNLYDVTSVIADVLNGLNGTTVFGDLGSGTLLGSVALPSNAAGNVAITLNANGVSYLNAGAGGSILVGLSIASAGPTDQYAFVNEGNAAEFADSLRVLDVTTTTPGGTATPEPTTCTLMLGALAGMVWLRRSR